MRISAHEDDHGFDPVLSRSQNVKIFFNGVEIKYVITADEEKCFVRRYVLDEAGRIALGSNGVPLEMVDFGKVRIEIDTGP